MLQVQSAIGLVAMAAFCWAVGCVVRRRMLGVPWRLVLVGLGAQAMIAAVLLNVPPIRAGFAAVGRAFDALATATQAGTSLVFGYLGGAPLPFAVTTPGADFILFFKALPLVLVVGALSALFYHWGVLPFLVRGLARTLRRGFGLSGAAGFSVAANVFVGMVEAPLMIKPWLLRLSRTELFVVMTAGLATISGNTLVVYALFLRDVVPDAAGQLLVASVIAAPASVLAALLMLPESQERSATAEDPGRMYTGSMEAIVRGTAEGLALLLGIMAALIVFVALATLIDMIQQPITGIPLTSLAGFVMRPFAVAMGVPADEVARVADSLGVKVIINEFVSYLQMAQTGGHGLSERSRLILTYALCGFTNLGSIGIMVGGMVAMCPDRKDDIAQLAPFSVVSATVACCMTGAVVGMLTPP
jgi:CNT family concentrative nucleoside transporter